MDEGEKAIRERKKERAQGESNESGEKCLVETKYYSR
jgi:hypothetical protein